MKKIIEKIYYLLVLVSVVFPAVSFADQGGIEEPKLKPPFKDGDMTIFSFLDFILNNIVLPIGAVIAVFFLVYSGFLFVTARGSEDKLKLAKANFIGAIIGVAILLGATAISLAIKGTICQIVNC